MSMEHSKYMREQKAKRDKQQTKFTLNGNITEAINNGKPKVTGDTIVLCPFCLHKDFLSKFLTTDSKGQISTFKVKCRECKQTMLMTTIKEMIDMTNPKRIEAYAKWCLKYRKAFWKKVKKDKWNKRLKKYGMEGIFWKTYRSLKASIPRPDYYEEEYYEDEYAQAREERLKQKEKEYYNGY